MATLFYYLCLEYWKAPEWLYGVYYTIFAIVWIIVIWQTVIQKNIDIFKPEENESKQPSEQRRPTFLEKLEERMKKNPHQKGINRHL